MAARLSTSIEQLAGSPVITPPTILPLLQTAPVIFRDRL